MRILRFVLGLLLAAALQTFGLHLNSSFFLAIDLFLVLAVYNSLDNGPAASMLGGSVAGLAQDALTGGLYGLHGFADTFVAWAAARLRQRLVIQQPVQVGLLFALTAALQQTILVILQYLMVPGTLLPGLGVMVVRMITTGVAGCLLFLSAGRMRHHVDTWRARRSQRLGLEVDLTENRSGSIRHD